ALWIFGAAMEQALGRTRFLLVFFVTGFLASAASYAFGPVQSVGVGASGAIFGVFGAFIAYNYRRRDLAQAAANLRWALMLILLNALLTLGIRQIDWRAQLGGLVAGFAAGLVAEGWGDRRGRTRVMGAGVAGATPRSSASRPEARLYPSRSHDTTASATVPVPSMTKSVGTDSIP